MPDFACVVDRVGSWGGLVALSLILLVARGVLFAPRLRRIGDPVPGLTALSDLIHQGRFRGVRVQIGPVADRGGGGFLAGRGRGEIWLTEELRQRADIDALAILEHERGHAARDLPIPSLARRAIGVAIVAGGGIALTRPDLAGVATSVALAAYALSVLVLLRDEIAASEYALRELWTRELPPPVWRQAVTRLGAALGVYLADAALAGALLAFLATLFVCR